MTVNGEAVHYRLDPETPLLWALRDASNLTGAKYGCADGTCGACTVIVDGRAATSCTLTIAALEGSNITTIEGLSSDRAHPVQQAWAAEQVSQCGFCDPGFIMAIAALLQASPNPSAGADRRAAQPLPVRGVSADPQGDLARGPGDGRCRADRVRYRRPKHRGHRPRNPAVGTGQAATGRSAGKSVQRRLIWASANQAHALIRLRGACYA